MLFLRSCFFILIALLGLFSNAISGTIRYVKESGTGDGSSWAQASGNLQTVIDLSLAGDQIWIAKGTYKPGLNSTFRLTKDMEIYGGFPDAGNPEMSNRDKANLTILQANGAGVLINSSAVTQATILDGLTFSGTQGNTAMINDGASPLVRDCIFKDNSAANGAGVNNKSASKAIFSKCIFENNVATSRGGAMLNTDDADVQLSNCIFVNNSAPYGPGIHAQSRSKSLVVNCIFYGNGGRGAITLFNSGVVNIYNSILWGTDEEGISRYDDSVFQLRYSISRTGAGGNVLNTDPLFVNPGDPAGTDGIWGTADDGLRLQMNSPVINNGDPQTNTTDYQAQAGTQDFYGHTRVFDSRVDMGAYEYPKKKQIMTLPGTPVGSTYYVYGTYGSGPIDLPKVTSTLGNIQYSVPANNGRVTIVDGKIQIINAGTTALTISSEGDETYDPITKTMTISIAKKSLSLAPNPNNPLVKEYDGSDYIYLDNASNFIFTGMLPGDEVYPKLNFSWPYFYFDSSNVGSNLTLILDGARILVAGASAGNYGFASRLDEIPNAGSIVPKPITITANSISKTYGDDDPELTYSLPANSLVGSDKITGSLSRAEGEDAGSYAIVQNTLTAGNNYTITYVGADLTISKASPALSGFDNINKVFGDNPFKLIAPASKSPGAFTYSSSDESVASISGETVSIHRAGTVILTATQAETANYLSETITLELTVAKADATLAFKVNGEIKDDDLNPATAAYGEIKSFSLETNSDARAQDFNFDLLEDYRDPYIDFSNLPNIKAIKVGTSYIEVTVPETDNFNEVKGKLKIVISKATATIALKDLLHKFDGSAKLVTAETDPSDLSGITITYNGSATPPVDPGVYSVVAKLVNSNYTAEDVTGILQIEAVLPVSLKMFSVKAQDNRAKIEWQTNNEQQNSYFELERSADGLRFDKIETVQGAGTSSAVLNYLVYDNTPLNGPNYYRLKQIDNNGKATILSVKSVNFQLRSAASVTAFPIPLSDTNLSLVFKNYIGKQVKVSLVEMGGKMVHSEFINSIIDSSVHKLNLEKKPAAGQYVLYLQGEGLKSVIKVIVL